MKLGATFVAAENRDLEHVLSSAVELDVKAALLPAILSEMSKENVEIVRRVFDAVASRDRETVFALYDPKVEIHFTQGTLADRMGGAGSFRGLEGVRAFDRELRQAFEDFETNCEELIEAGERVVSVSRYRARGRRSGVVVDGPPQFGIWTITGGRITRIDWFDTREAALKAAGLQE